MAILDRIIHLEEPAIPHHELHALLLAHKVTAVPLTRATLQTLLTDPNGDFAFDADGRTGEWTKFETWLDSSAWTFTGNQTAQDAARHDFLLQVQAAWLIGIQGYRDKAWVRNTTNFDAV